ncbi:MAG: diaminopimelate epimerase [Gammaproteobacteria bacterium]|nr:diaminopimelate epimerase [Gammaproteobacteria bacterium]MDD9896501.1 diaminopimelate epimerase [Gammaproteobacteria bacterium]MDD9958744.1 diaminopimelate epimerase [Gammaproteobacteria bacterium]
MRIPFTKMHGLGNDFIVMDLTSRDIQLSANQIQKLSHRQFGIGFDQLLQIRPASSPEVDFDYRIFNANGEEVEHCGNGARCFARFVYEKGLSDKNPLTVKTVNRILVLHSDADGEVTVDMGAPVFAPAAIPFNNPTEELLYARKLDIAGNSRELKFVALSMGNPHAVISVEDLDNTAVKDIGEAVTSHPDFPEGVNVGFMKILNRNEINLRVYERGAGETLACGTGACAAVVAGCLLEQLDDNVKVNLTGGQLRVRWQKDTSPVLMSGPATTVYEGTFEI